MMGVRHGDHAGSSGICAQCAYRLVEHRRSELDAERAGEPAQHGDTIILGVTCQVNRADCWCC